MKRIALTTNIKLWCWFTVCLYDSQLSNRLVCNRTEFNVFWPWKRNTQV